MINLFARLVRAVRTVRAPAGDEYAAGYADGLDASPLSPNTTLATARTRRKGWTS